MAERSNQDLRYGHSGQAIYNSEPRDWIFNRNISRGLVLEPLGSASTPISPSLQTDQLEFFDSTKLRAQVQRVTKAHSQTFPAADSILWEGRVSETVAAQLSELNPDRGDTFDIGIVFPESLSSGLSNDPTIAIVGGLAGDRLRLIPLRKDKQGWSKDASKFIQSLEPNTTEVCEWTGIKEAILHVCWGRSHSNHWTYIGVRTATSICLLVPTRHTSHKISLSELGEYNSSAGIVKLRHFFTASTPDIGGSPPADMCFDPWDHRSWAILTQKGHWSIWRSSGMSRAPEKIKCATKGQFQKLQTDEMNAEADFEDGWGRMLWVKDENTIIACCRTYVGIGDIQTGKTEDATAILASPDRSAWILDMRPHPNFGDQVFVLTTRRILWLQIYDQGEELTKEPSKTAVRILLSWNHFRDPEDMSLKLSINQDEYGNLYSDHLLNDSHLLSLGILLILYSRLNFLATLFKYTRDSATSAPLSIFDPIPISFPSQLLGGQDPGRSIAGLTLSPITYQEMSGLGLYWKRGLWHEYKGKDIRFYKMMVANSDLSVRTMLYFVRPAASKSGNDSSIVVVQPTWRHISSQIYAGVGAIDSERFIADEGDVLPNDEGDLPGYQPPQWRQTGLTANQERILYAEKAWKRSNPPFRRVYNEVSAAAQRKVDFSEILDMMRDEIQNRNTQGGTTMQLLSDLIPSSPAVNEVDKSARLLQEYARSPGYADPASAQKNAQLISTTAIKTLVEISNQFPDLRATIESLRKTWSATQYTTNPSKVNLLNSIAAEICLASLCIPGAPSQPPNTTIVPSSAPPLPSTQLSLPVRPSQPISQPLPQPSLSQTSSQPSSSRPSSQLPSSQTNPSSRPTQSPSAIHISTYAAISPLPPPLPKRLSNLLLHWEPGVDPATYNYEATTARLAVSKEDVEREEKEEREREEKLRRKREMILRRAGRKVDGEGGSQGLSQSQSQSQSGGRMAPGLVVGGSQPTRGSIPGFGSGGVVGRERGEPSTQPSREQETMSQVQIQGSQQDSQSQGQMPGLAVASQIEPGRFGGRVVAGGGGGGGPAKKKVKRAQGFR
ncbi:MAG: hypothetical protein M1820_000632 [Bogoriella megaspora]|nr:MAG: hypothetical protein M1820_000632 [Bogoriella megaspora]